MALMPYCFEDDTESPAEKFCRVNNVAVEKISSFEDALRVIHNGKYRLEAHFDNKGRQDDKDFIVKLFSNKIFDENQLLESDFVDRFHRSKWRDITEEGRMKIRNNFERIFHCRKGLFPAFIRNIDFKLISKKGGY